MSDEACDVSHAVLVERLAALTKFVAHERELREQNERLTKEALRLQANVYESRLTTLNHAHERAVEEQLRTVPRETFNLFRDRTQSDVKEIVARIGALDAGITRTLSEKDLTAVKDRLTVVEQGLSNVNARAMTWTAAIGLVLILVQIALQVVN